MVHGQALRMRLELQRLAQRHGVVLADAVTLPLVSYSDHDLIVEGYASTSDIDLTRMKFRSHAICWPPFTRAGDVPLLYRHDPAQPAGRVDSLDYDDRGRLLVAPRSPIPRLGAVPLSVCWCHGAALRAARRR